VQNHKKIKKNSMVPLCQHLVPLC